MGEVLGLAFTAAAYPTLAAAVTVMLVLPKPKRLLLGYLLGAYTVSITIGLLIVFQFHGSQGVDESQTTLSPLLDLVIGAIALLIAAALATDRDKRVVERRKQKVAKKGEPRWRRTIGRGSPRVTFAVGCALSLPSVTYLIALGRIDKLDYGTTETVGVVVLFNLIMFLIAEVPLIGYTISPDGTQRMIERMKAWMARSGRRTAIVAALIVAAYMITRGIIGLA